LNNLASDDLQALGTAQVAALATDQVAGYRAAPRWH
jgi:hypothetical protein